MTKEIDALETMDEFSDDHYSAFPPTQKRPPQPRLVVQSPMGF